MAQAHSHNVLVMHFYLLFLISERVYTCRWQICDWSMLCATQIGVLQYNLHACMSLLVSLLASWGTLLMCHTVVA